MAKETFAGPLEPAGTCCYVYGASGSGKTTLLERLRGDIARDDTAIASGSVIVPSDASIGAKP